ncbi:MAG: HAMP domain-containing histidine kinase [Alphaproteobacteria bacterium]|nr:HAMP domain-containing histidine kinase [Alphaproteobacteria bacterium]
MLSIAGLRCLGAILPPGEKALQPQSTVEDREKPETRHALRRWRPEFTDPATEKRFLVNEWTAIVLQTRIALGIGCAVTFAFLIPDYLAFGDDPAFPWIAAIRVSAAGLIAFSVWYGTAVPDYERYSTAALVGLLAMNGVIITLWLIKPRPDLVPFASMPFIVFIYYVLVPNRPSRNLVAGVTLSAGMVFSFIGRGGIPAPLVAVAIVLGILANVGGYLAAWSAARNARRAFAARLAAEEANRAKSQFLAAMSHDLRTPLNAIGGFAQMIESRVIGPIGDRYVAYATDIRRSAGYLQNLVDDLLDISRLEVGRYELKETAIEPEPVLRECLAQIESRAEEAGISIDVAIAALPRLRADERALRQMVLNLLTNAVKFTPRGGRVRLGAGRNPMGGIEIVIADTGIGMSTTDQLDLFQPFVKVGPGAKRPDSTGLGLVITRELITLHQGRIGLSSAPGQGTIVTLTFPEARIVPS